MLEDDIDEAIKKSDKEFRVAMRKYDKESQRSYKRLNETLKAHPELKPIVDYMTVQFNFSRAFSFFLLDSMRILHSKRTKKCEGRN